ncbi:MAG: hypothetical protein WCK29_02785, partial [archaeon]
MTQTNNESALIEKLIIYEGFLIRQFLDAEEIAKPIKEKRRLFEDLVTEQEVLKQEMAENQAQTYISALKQFRSKFPEINRLEINV